MHDKPLIGLNSETPARNPEDNRRLWPTLCRWVEVVTRAGGIPLVVPSLSCALDIGHVLEHLQGIICVGMTDYEPATEDCPWDFEEDPSLTLIRAVAQRNVPFLGVGRGLQLLNVALGGNLGRVGVRPRRTAPAYPHNPLHALYTWPGSLVARVFGDGCSFINSPLEWSADEVALELTVTGWRRDKTVEAVESESTEWLAVAVRFQPEALGTAELDVALCETFVKQVAERDTAAAATGLW